MIDLSNTKIVEVKIGERKLWVNVDGVCVLRIQDIPQLALELPVKSPQHAEIIIEKVL